MEDSMPKMMKPLIFVILVSYAIGAFSFHNDQDVAVADQRDGIIATRIYTGSDGQTHAEKINIPLAPSGVSTQLSEMASATGVQFRRQAAHYFEDWHTAPRRQYVITLSGRGEIELTDGKKIQLGPGDILLAEDLTGKGHISRGVGTEDRVSLIIPLPE
jgi:hypothetical protein